MRARTAAGRVVAVAFAGLLLGSVAASQVNSANGQQSSNPRALQERAIALLRAAVRTEKEFVRIHAAEALLNGRHPEGLRDLFGPEVATAAPMYRIGVWRVMAQLAADDAADRAGYVGRITSAFLDRSGPDRIHAAETLGKLRSVPSRAAVLPTATGEPGQLQIMARWILANSGDASDEARLVELLDAADAGVRGSTAYALRFLKQVRPATLKKLEDVTRSEPPKSEARAYLLGALATHLPAARRESTLGELRRYLDAGTAADKFEAAFVIGLQGQSRDIPAMEKLMADPDPDTRIVGAQAVLLILNRGV